jgi:DNA invertase Pin-like site-specific DNA recombinase
MAKIGYIFNPGNSETLECDRQWMTDYGCREIIEDTEENEHLRPEWKQMLSTLKNGDELILAKLSNAVRGSRELIALLEYARIKAIRLISVQDRIDSRNILFPETRNSDLLTILALLPYDINSLRSSLCRKKRMASKQPIRVHKKDRDTLIINMYQSGYPIEEIWRMSGFRSCSSVFRILKNSGLQSRRYNRNNSRCKV